MRLLLDECVPRRVKFLLTAASHERTTVAEAGFRGKRNGELLELAEEHFDVLFTIDRNIQHQQNLAGRKIAILVVRAVSNDIDDIRPHIPRALEALSEIQEGQVVEVGGEI